MSAGTLCMAIALTCVALLLFARWRFPAPNRKAADAHQRQEQERMRSTRPAGRRLV